MNNINELISGGKLLAKGSFGCVYKPALKCKGSSKRLDGYVSKLMNTQDAYSEINEQKEIDKIDPEYNYHLRTGKECVPDKPDLKTDDLLRGCHLQGEDLHVYHNDPDLQYYYLNVHIEDGGMGLSDYLLTKNEFYDVKKCELMMFDFTRLIYGLDQFHKNKWGHFDLKTDNIVYNKDKNRFNFIDFGFSAKQDEFYNKNEVWGLNYWVNPMERILLNINRRDVLTYYNELFKIAESDIMLKDINAHMKDPIKGALIYNYINSAEKLFTNLYKHTFREEFSNIYTDISHNAHGPYGLNENVNPGHIMLFDYVEETRRLLKSGLTPHEIMLDAQIKIISKIDTFSMSLTMIEMLKTFLDNIYKKNVLIPVSYETKHTTDFRNKINSISPVFGSFYELLLKMNIPTYTNRITTAEALQYYTTHIYDVIIKTHSLQPLSFIVHTKIFSSQHNKTQRKSATLIKRSGVKTAKSAKPQLIKMCDPSKIKNPLTGRCIDKKGALTKTLKNKELISKSYSSIKKTKRLVNVKICKEHKVLNPVSRRCVNKSGAVAKKHNLK
jgi:serine/threonine protein kinase